MDELLAALARCTIAVNEAVKELRTFKISATEITRAKELQAQTEFRCGQLTQENIDAQHMIRELSTENLNLRAKLNG